MAHLGAACVTARTTVNHVLLSTLVRALCAEGVGARLVGGDVEVCGLCRVAAEAQPDDLFVCGGPEALPEELGLAVGHGAAASLVGEESYGAFAKALDLAALDVCAIVVDDVGRAAACVAPLFERDRSRDV